MTTNEAQSDASRERVDLLPCPFCDGDAENIRRLDGQLYWVECVTCDATVYGGTRAEADAAWNSRTSDHAASPITVARLNEALLAADRASGDAGDDYTAKYLNMVLSHLGTSDHAANVAAGRAADDALHSHIERAARTSKWLREHKHPQARAADSVDALIAALTSPPTDLRAAGRAEGLEAARLEERASVIQYCKWLAYELSNPDVYDVIDGLEARDHLDKALATSPDAGDVERVVCGSVKRRDDCEPHS